MFTELGKIFERPKPYESNDTYTKIWTDEYISKNMLEIHLNPQIDAASRNHCNAPRFSSHRVQFFHAKLAR